MGDWQQPPEFAADEIPMIIYDRKALDVAVGGHRKAPPAPPGFVPERLKGSMKTYEARSEKRIAKQREMAERADLIRSGVMTRQQIADAYGVTVGSIKEQVRNMAAKGGRDGQARTSTEAQSGQGARRQGEPQAAAGRDEAPSEAAA